MIGDAALGVGPIVARDARFVKWPKGPGFGIQIPTIDRIDMRGPRAGGLIPLASSSRITRPR